MSLFEDCKKALATNCSSLGKIESDFIVNEMTSFFPITKWGRIDWSFLDNKAKIAYQKRYTELKKILKEEQNESLYIIWDDEDLPILKTTLKMALGHIDDVTAVSFDTWFFLPDKKIVVEFYHDNTITVGRSE